jgi:hypothetical protein
MRTKRDRLNEIEDIGFYAVMIFASITIGFSVIRILVKLFGYE